jgi:PAS domain S-box-containing protein
VTPPRELTVPQARSVDPPATAIPPAASSLAGGLFDVVSLIGADGRCGYVGSAVRGLLGTEPGAIVGRSLVELLHPDDEEAFRHWVRQLAADGPVPGMVRYRLRHADGTWRAVEVQAIGRIDQEGGPTSVTVIRAAHRTSVPALTTLDEAVGLLPEPVVLVDVGTPEPYRVVFANAAFLAHFGHREADVLGRPVDALVTAETGDPFAGGGALGVVEASLRAADGTPVWVDLTLAHVPGPGSCVMAVLHDATRRRAAEDRWRDSRERVRRLAQQSPDTIYRIRLRPEISIEFLSSATEKLIGYPADEIRRDPMLLNQAVHPDDRHLLRSLTGSGSTGPLTEVPGELVLRWRHRDGRIVWTELRVVAEHGPDGGVVAIEGTARDITVRKLADLASAERETFALAVLDGIGAETVVLDPHGVVSRANRAWSDLISLFQPAELGGGVGRPYLELVKAVLGVGDRVTELSTGIAEVMRGTRAHLEVDVASDVRGTRRWYTVRASPLTGAPGGGAVLTHTEITARKEAEDRLTASEARYRSIIDTVHDVVYQLDGDGRFTFLNHSWEQLTGWSVDESLGRTIWSVMAPDEQAAGESGFFAFLRGELEADVRYRFTLVTSDGGARMVEVSPQLFRVDGEIVGTTGTLVDVTDQLHDEVELRHAQKLEAVGRLAAGIAHEVNTPVQFVGDNLQFLDDAFDSLVTLLGKYRTSLSPDSQIKTWAERQAFLSSAEVDGEAEFYEQEIPKAVAEAREGAQRIASIVRAMKAFGHPDAAEQQATDLNEAVRNTVIVARNEYKYIADVELDLGELPAVVCHAGDVNQALLNLIVNSAHAIHDVVGDSGERGRITVRTAIDDDAVVITVTDSGPGIPESIRHRVFEPFFTTKEVGRGTGQGLALVRAVADRHRGQVSFDTGEAGTTFHLRLPLLGTGNREAVR